MTLLPNATALNQTNPNLRRATRMQRALRNPRRQPAKRGFVQVKPFSSRRPFPFKRLLVGLLGMGGLVALGGLGWQLLQPKSDVSWLTLPQASAVAQSPYMADSPANPMTASTPVVPNQGASLALPAEAADQTLVGLLQPIIDNPQYAGLGPHVYIQNVATGATYAYRADEAVASASVIKLPILAVLFQDMAQGRLKSDTPIAYMERHRAEGSGYLQYQDANKTLPAAEAARLMIQDSDNATTNMLVETLGGVERLNRQWADWGMGQTRIREWLPNIEGTNTISMRDMAKVLWAIDQERSPLCGQFCTTAKAILEGTHNRRLIPASLPAGSVVEHKTGDIGSSLGNSALVTLPNGQRFLMTVQVERPHNDPRAAELIRSLAKVTADHFMTAPSQLVANARVASPTVQPAAAQAENPLEAVAAVAKPDETVVISSEPVTTDTVPSHTTGTSAIQVIGEPTTSSRQHIHTPS
jgi:beta-lactamase class A